MGLVATALAPGAGGNGEDTAHSTYADDLLSARLTAPVGTPFEFSVDWTQGTASIRPLALGSPELPDPDAGCLVTEAGFAWVVDPPGLQTMGECAQRVDHLWPIARSSLVCVAGFGTCFMVLEGGPMGAGFGGFAYLQCDRGPGINLQVWPHDPPLTTTDCQTGSGGQNPARWETWSGKVWLLPASRVSDGMSWGLNWRAEL